MLDSIPRIRREIVDQWWAAKTYFPPAVRRPSAHVLTVLALNADGPTYSFECREPADDRDKRCAPWVVCECEPQVRTRENLPDEDAPCPKSPTGKHEWRDGLCWRPANGCMYAYADAEETDEAVRRLVSERRLFRGVYFVEAQRDLTDSEIQFELLAIMGSVVGSLPDEPTGLTARPTTAMRYPGYGPEVDLRELIEESLSEDPGALEWDDEELTVTVDAAQAAKRVLAWIEQTYDVPPDQLSFSTLPARVRKSDDLRRHGVVSLPVRGDVL